MTYPKYEKYKESGVPWLGQVPEGWDLVPIKWITSVKRGASPRPIENPIYFDDDGEYAWVRIADVTASDAYLSKTEQRLSELGSSLSVKMQPGQLFLSIAGSVGKPIITNIKCCIHDGFVYFPELNGDPKFLFYIFLSGQPYLGLGKLGTQLNLNTDTVGAITIGYPPLPEQKAIAAFLDKKTAEIDALIAKKEELLKLLAEQRTALITHAVTKGLNLSAPMKDSGIDWLGHIPAHWDVKKVKYVANRVYTGGTPPSTGPDYFEDGSVAWFSPSDFRDENIYLGNSKKKVRHEVFEETGIKLFPENSVLLVGIGATLGKVGVSKEACTSNQQINAIVPKENILPAFLTYFLLVQRSTLKIISNSTTLGIINQEKTKSVELALPPIEEQQKILDYVDGKLKHMDAVVDKTQQAIDRLKEYRTALITNAVTGKIDVRGYQSKNKEKAA